LKDKLNKRKKWFNFRTFVL